MIAPDAASKRARAVEAPAQVDSDDPVPQFIGDIAAARSEIDDPGIAEKYVQPALRCRGMFNQSLDRFRLAGIRDNDLSAATGPSRQRCRLLSSCRVDVYNGNRGPFPAEGNCCCPTDSRTRARHDDGFPIEAVHCFVST